MRHLLARCLVCCSVAPSLIAQDVAPAAQLVAQLAGEHRGAAHEQLVVLGSTAVPALIEALGRNDKAVTREVLTILREIGPEAAPALSPVLEAMPTLAPECVAAALWTVAELAPFRPARAILDADDLTRRLIQGASSRVVLEDVEGALALQRMRARAEFPHDLVLSDLIRAAQGCQAYRVEVAVELLGRLGPQAQAALPVLEKLLDRPDPTVLTTAHTVPLRRKAARAILAIAPASVTATHARAVLAGKELPAREAPIPERLRARITDLIAELGVPAKREAAIANLVALGAACAPALVDALAARTDAGLRDAAVAVLHELGPAAASAAPRLLDLLLTSSTEQTLALMRAFTAVAPACRDVVPSPSAGLGSDRLELFGRRIAGAADIEFLNRVSEAFQVLLAALAVDPSATLPELEQMLASQDVLKREAALEVLRHRGAAARSALPAIGGMLDQRQPKHHVSRRLSASSARSQMDDRSEFVHRLAAQTILAVAAPNDPLVATARDVLVRLADLPKQSK